MFVAGSYVEWNQKRIKAVIDYYGHQFFFKKKILDLGCGHGDIGGVLHRLGADVIAVDARQEHLKMLSQRYSGVKTVRADLDQPWPFFGKTFDIVIDMGLICHLNNFETHIKAICSSTKYLVLETAVLDSSDSSACLVKPDNKDIFDGSFNGFSSQVSAENIERVLKNCGFTFKRLDIDKLNAGAYVYNWESRDDNTYDLNKRRIWFCSKETEVHIQIVPPSTLQIPIHGGSITNLLDSKVPITHQHLMTSRSPTPPTGPHTAPPIISINPIYPGNTPIPPPFIPSFAPADKPIGDYRVAVLISGHLRHFEKTSKSFINNILGGSKERADIFIHTWETLEVPKPKMGTENNSLVAITTDSKVNIINSVFAPKNLIIEKYSIQDQIRNHCCGAHLTIQEKNGFFGNDLIHFSCMLFTWKKVFQMMEDYEKKYNFKYDLIIKYRPDIVFPDKLEILSTVASSNTICTPNIATYYTNGMNDQFAYGDHIGMKTYCHLYDQEVDYINKRVINPLRPETLLKYHMINNGVSLRTIPMRYYILRGNNEILVPHGISMMGSNNLHLIDHLI